MSLKCARVPGLPVHRGPPMIVLSRTQLFYSIVKILYSNDSSSSLWAQSSTQQDLVFLFMQPSWIIIIITIAIKVSGIKRLWLCNIIYVLEQHLLCLVVLLLSEVEITDSSSSCTYLLSVPIDIVPPLSSAYSAYIKRHNGHMDVRNYFTLYRIAESFLIWWGF